MRRDVIEGRDAVANAIIALFRNHGWTPDHYLKNTAVKLFGRDYAEVWVERCHETSQYLILPSYRREGCNVLASNAMLTRFDIDAIECKLSPYISEIEAIIKLG